MKPSKLSFYKVWKSAIFFLLLGLAGLLSLASCQTQKKPSILVIAVDRLAFNSFACSDDKSTLNSGFSILCREALRFTHAYTTSTQSAAAIGSLLTGLYPYQSRLHRSFDRIDSKAEQLQSFALQEGYRTAFWSGSPTLLKKTGLSKDFETFDDSAFLEKKNFFSSLKNQCEVFLNWTQESKAPYFSVIYNSELENLNEGESEISSFEKMDETLASFFNELKKEGLWEDNYVVVTGLQGQSIYNRLKETPFSNLHSENTNVLLFIKPPRQKGDEGVNWKVDTPLTLADIGYSLIKTFQPDYLNAIDLQFPIWDFSSLWLKTDPEADLNASRHLLVESANTWKKTIENRFAVLYKNLIHVEDEHDEVYNLLTDGLETIDLSKEQKEFLVQNQNDLALVRKQKELAKWVNYQPRQYNWVLSNHEYWSQPNNRESLLDQEIKNLIDGQTAQPLSILAIQALAIKNKKDILQQILGKKLLVSGPKQVLTPAEKEFELTDVRRQSLNLSLENIWGIWSEDQEWLQSALIKEYQ